MEGNRSFVNLLAALFPFEISVRIRKLRERLVDNDDDDDATNLRDQEIVVNVI